MKSGHVCAILLVLMLVASDVSLTQASWDQWWTYDGISGRTRVLLLLAIHPPILLLLPMPSARVSSYAAVPCAPLVLASLSQCSPVW